MRAVMCHTWHAGWRVGVGRHLPAAMGATCGVTQRAGTALPATGATKARLGRWRAPISSPQGAVDVGSDCRRCPQPVDTETAWACAQHVRMAWGSLTRLERAHML